MRTGETLMGSKLFSMAMDSTFYGQFVAGETGPAVIEAAKRLKGQGLTLMVAPALESDLGEGSNSGYICHSSDFYSIIILYLSSFQFTRHEHE